MADDTTGTLLHCESLTHPGQSLPLCIWFQMLYLIPDTSQRSPLLSSCYFPQQWGCLTPGAYIFTAISLCFRASSSKHPAPI